MKPIIAFQVEMLEEFTYFHNTRKLVKNKNTGGMGQ